MWLLTNKRTAATKTFTKKYSLMIALFNGKKKKWFPLSVQSNSVHVTFWPKNEWILRTKCIALVTYPIFLRFCGKYINFERFSIIWDQPQTSSSICLTFVCLWKQVFSNQARKKWFSLQSGTSSNVLLTTNYSIMKSEFWHDKIVSCYWHSLKIWRFLG